MEPTSSPENARQSRGLARFWPSHGIPAPVQRESEEDARDDTGAAGAPAGAEQQRLDLAEQRRPAEAATPGSRAAGSDAPPRGDAQGERSAAERGHPALIGETQMVALGSRRPPEVLLGPASGGYGWTGNQADFPPVDGERARRNGDPGPRHGGAPVPNGLLPAASMALPPAQSAFPPPPPGGSAPTAPFGPPGPFGSGPRGQAVQPFGPVASTPQASPYAASPVAPRMPEKSERDPGGRTGAATGTRGDDGVRPTGVRPTGGTGPGGGGPALGAPAPAQPVSGGAPHPPAGRGDVPDADRPDADLPDADLPDADLPDADPPDADPPDADGADADGAGAARPRAGARPGSAPETSRPGQRPDPGPAWHGAPGHVDQPAAATSPEEHSGDAADGTVATGRAGVPGREAADWAAGPTSGNAVPASSWATPAGAVPGHAEPARDAHPTHPAGGTAYGSAAVSPRAGRRSVEDEETGRRSGADERDTSPGPLGQDEDGRRRRSLRDDRATRDAEPDEGSRLRRSISLDVADEPRLGRRAARAAKVADGEFGAAGETGSEDEQRGGATALRPGDVGESHIAFWDPEATRHFRAEWHEVKADFVDDPVAALTRAHDLLTNAVHELTESLLAERDQLDPLRTTATPDTESMRMAMRGYREFLDRILAL
jgi:hypothetical protein